MIFIVPPVFERLVRVGLSVWIITIGRLDDVKSTLLGADEGLYSAFIPKPPPMGIPPGIWPPCS